MDFKLFELFKRQKKKKEAKSKLHVMEKSLIREKIEKADSRKLILAKYARYADWYSNSLYLTVE